MNFIGSRISFIVLLGSLLLLACQTSSHIRPEGPLAERLGQGPGKVRFHYIDGHNHLYGGDEGGVDYFGAARVAISKMDKLGIGRMIIAPPPGIGSHAPCDVYDLLPIVKRYPGRFSCMGGGGTLNVMIHAFKNETRISAEVKNRFKRKAKEILSRGAIGFGELAVEHFSFAYNHPYQSAPADHPLFLLLADIAAEHHVPISIHMEAVPRDMPLPNRKILRRSGRNPETLRENISAFERLLAHNRAAKIIWEHLGWCNTGFRTPRLCRRLLKDHPNLYMSIKLSPDSVPHTRPLTKDHRAIRPEWLSLFREFPERFFIGTDQFYGPPGSHQIGPQKTEATRLFMELLPIDLARKIGVENPRDIFNL